MIYTYVYTVLFLWFTGCPLRGQSVHLQVSSSSSDAAVVVSKENGAVCVRSLSMNGPLIVHIPRHDGSYVSIGIDWIRLIEQHHSRRMSQGTLVDLIDDRTALVTYYLDSLDHKFLALVSPDVFVPIEAGVTSAKSSSDGHVVVYTMTGSAGLDSLLSYDCKSYTRELIGLVERGTSVQWVASDARSIVVLQSQGWFVLDGRSGLSLGAVFKPFGTHVLADRITPDGRYIIVERTDDSRRSSLLAYGIIDGRLAYSVDLGLNEDWHRSSNVILSSDGETAVVTRANNAFIEVSLSTLSINKYRSNSSAFSIYSVLPNRRGVVARSYGGNHPSAVAVFRFESIDTPVHFCQYLSFTATDARLDRSGQQLYIIEPPIRSPGQLYQLDLSNLATVNVIIAPNIVRFPTYSDQVASVRFDNNGSTTTLIQLGTLRERIVHSWPGKGFPNAMSALASRIAYYYEQEDRVEVVDTRSNEVVAEFSVEGWTSKEYLFERMQLSRDGKILLCLGSHGFCFDVDAKKSIPIPRAYRSTGLFSNRRMSGDGEVFVAEESRGVLSLYNRISKQTRYVRADSGDRFRFASFSDDDSSLIALTENGHVFRWNVHSLNREDYFTIPLTLNRVGGRGRVSWLRDKELYAINYSDDQCVVVVNRSTVAVKNAGESDPVPTIAAVATSSDIIRIPYSDAIDISAIAVDGRRVNVQYSADSDSIQIAVTSLPHGVYTIVVRNRDGKDIVFQLMKL